MKKLKAIFVDDEPLQHQVIRELLTQSKYRVEPLFYQGQHDFFFALEDQLDTDVIFLDVEMPGMDGLAMAHRIRAVLPEVPIVFITGFTQYAIKGYEVSALDYLLKPVSLERLEQALQKVQDILPPSEHILLLDRQKVRAEDIYYIEAQGHKCLITLADAVLRITESLAQLAQQLPEEFVQTHRAYWVNLAHVFQVNKDHVVLDNQQTIPLSRRQSKQVLAAFVAHYQRQAYSL